jgi:PAS domain S-box-containing protein
MPKGKNTDNKSSGKPRIIVVGDNSKILALYPKILKTLSSSFHLFENLTNAQKFYEKNYQDIDIFLIDSSGITQKLMNFCKNIKKINPKEHIILVKDTQSLDSFLKKIDNIQYVLKREVLLQSLDSKNNLVHNYFQKVQNQKKLDQKQNKVEQKTLQDTQMLEKENLRLKEQRQQLNIENKQLKLTQKHTEIAKKQLLLTNQQLRKNNEDSRKANKKLQEKITTLEAIKTLSEKTADIHHPPVEIFQKMAKMITPLWDCPQGRKKFFRAINNQLNQLESRKEAEEKSRKREKQYQLLAENITDVVWTMDINLKFTYVSPSMKSIFGYSSQDTKKLSFDEIVTPESYETIVYTLESLLSKKPGMDSTVTSSKTIECEIVCKNGKKLWNELKISLITNEDSLPTGFLAVSRDITIRKQAENELKFFNSLLRHDVSNKNQIAIGYLQLLFETGLSEDQRGFVEKALVATRASSELIKKVRDLEKVKEQSVVEAVSVDGVVERVVTEFSSVAGERGIEIVFQPSNFVVCANSLLEDVFSNLVQNAITHSGCSKIVISAVGDRDFCRISVEDDGEGIPDEKKGDVFEKWMKGGKSEGTGIGLHLVRSIVEGYQGRVEVRDRVVKGVMCGTVFDVYVPLFQEGGG